MQINKLPGSGKSEKRKRFNADFYEQWSGLISRGNWYDFTLVKIVGEYSPYKGSVEIELALLGLQLTFTYIYDWTFTERMTSIRDETIAALEAVTGATTVHDPLDQLNKLDDIH